MASLFRSHTALSLLLITLCVSTFVMALAKNVKSDCNGIFMDGNETQPFLSPPAAHSSSHSPFSPAVIAIVGILGLAFLLVSYYTIFAKYCTSRQALGRRPRAASPDEVFATDASVPMLTRGLDEAVIKAIPVCKYVKGDGLVEGTECAVCLSEFEANESLRLLPKCSHAFHIRCIDKWLQSQSNCPLCRANIVSTMSAPSTEPGIADLTSQGHLLDASMEQEDHPQNCNLSTENRFPNTQAGLSSSSEEQTDENVLLNRGGLELLKPECKASARLPDGQSGGLGHRAHVRSFTVDSTSNIVPRKHRYLYFKRSFSLGSSSRDVVTEFPIAHEWFEASIADCGFEKQRKAFATLKEPKSACAGLEDPVSTVVVEMPATGSSSSQMTNANAKSKSYSHAIDPKSKADDLPRGKVFMSLKDHLSLKRSFSGGRLFSFMNSRGRSTAVADISRLPL